MTDGRGDGYQKREAGKRAVEKADTLGRGDGYPRGGMGMGRSVCGREMRHLASAQHISDMR